MWPFWFHVMAGSVDASVSIARALAIMMPIAVVFCALDNDLLPLPRF